MPARRKRPMGRSAIRLMDPLDPESQKNPDNMALVDILLFGDMCMSWLLLNDTSPFSNEEEEHACWIANRETLLALVATRPGQDFRIPPGCRPRAWWRWESGTDFWKDSERFAPWHYQAWQLEYLQEHGLLREGEAEQAVGFRAAMEAAIPRPPAPEPEAAEQSE